jgi:hypothetical protein
MRVVLLVSCALLLLGVCAPMPVYAQAQACCGRCDPSNWSWTDGSCMSYTYGSRCYYQRYDCVVNHVDDYPQPVVCVDSDGDGKPDVACGGRPADLCPNDGCDMCAYMVNGQDVNYLDSDGDGVQNRDDPDIDGDGLLNGVDPDMDGDAIPNALDDCAMRPTGGGFRSTGDTDGNGWKDSTCGGANGGQAQQSCFWKKTWYPADVGYDATQCTVANCVYTQYYYNYKCAGDAELPCPCSVNGSNTKANYFDVIRGSTSRPH